MSTYIKTENSLEFDNAPDWLVAYMQYRRVILGNTPESIMTYFKALREFCQWAYIVKKTGSSPKTAADLRAVTILGMPVKLMANLTRNDIESYLYFTVNTLGNTPAARNKKLSALRGLFQHLCDQQSNLEIRMSGNPVIGIPHAKSERKQPIFLPDEERKSLLRSISGENACRDYAIFLLMLTCGLRVSEVVRIDMKDLNLEAQFIRIHGKGNKERIANLTLPCRDAISRYIMEYRKALPQDGLKSDALFVSRRRLDRLTARSIEKSMHKYTLAARLGGNGYTPHKLRHTMATILAQDGVDLLKIQNIMGHTNPNTTQIYTHLGNADIAQAVHESRLEKMGKD